MSCEPLLESMEYINTLFSERGDIATNSTKHLGTLNGTEAARNLLLQFHHA